MLLHFFRSQSPQGKAHSLKHHHARKRQRRGSGRCGAFIGSDEWRAWAHQTEARGDAARTAMPTLNNPRHEAFAQAIAKGFRRDEAYASAGYKPHRQAAHRLLTNVDVQSRVEELQEAIAEKAEWTASDRLRMLAEIAAAAIDGDPRVAVSAIAEANKMQGSHAPAKMAQTDPDGNAVPVTRIELVAPSANGKG